MEEKVRFAMIGAGGIAQSYAQALDDCESARLVAVADVRGETARALAERCRCPSFGSHEALAAGAEFDAVIICTPPVTHPAISLYFLERDVHVLCEKPLSIDSASARKMLAAADQAGVQLSMASKYRYVEDVVLAKSIVASGILGEIILFENAFTSHVDMAPRWNSNPRISGGGVLIDNGAHAVDLMRYFLGPLSAVQAIEGKRVQGLEVEDTVRIFVRSASGIMGSSDLSWSINKELDSYIRIYGSQGAISVGWKQSRYRHSSTRDWIVFGKGYDKVQAFRSQLDNFARAIQGKESLLITAKDAVASVDVIEAAYRSLRQDAWIPVNGYALERQEIKWQDPPESPESVMAAYVHPTAIIEEGVQIGPGTRVWDHVHIRRCARLGEECIVGEKTYIAYGVKIGHRVKINALVYLCTAVTVEDGVMISAGTIFTNDRFPRATTPDLKTLRPSTPDEHTLPTLVREGATIGAGCTIGNDLIIGRFAMIGMGSLVVKSVPDFHLAIGNPARSVGCVCRCGQLLRRFCNDEKTDQEKVACSACALSYEIRDQVVTESRPPS